MIVVYFYSAKSKENPIEDRLVQLRCHFTWELQIEDTEITDLEHRTYREIEYLDTKFNVAIHNLLAYIKYLKGQNKEALKSLKQAEDLSQTEHAGQSEVRRLVTWGNYAWLYYRVGRLEETQIYLDKVESTCKKFASPSCYSVDCEEGWALLKCEGKNYERAKACFEKALEVDPQNPEFNTGYAIVVYRLNGFNRASETGEAFCLQTLKRAIELNPEDVYIKALLALKLQDMGQEAEGEKYIKEALTNMSSQTYVFRYAAKFYRRKGSVDKALHFLKKALWATPSSAFLHHQVGLCYKTQMIQIKKANNWQPRGWDRENIHRLVQMAICEFKKALELRPRFHTVRIDLAEMYAELGQHGEAEDIFQKLLSMGIFHDNLHQSIHFCYGRFQEFHKKSEVNAIIHYLKAINKENSLFTSNKSLRALEKLVLRRLRRNEAVIESLSILGFIYKWRGEMHKALG